MATLSRRRRILRPCLILLSLLIVSIQPVISADDRIVVVAHPDNSHTITQEDLYRLYFGKLTTLPSGQRLVAIVNNGDEAQLKLFSNLVLQRSSQQLRSYWARQLFTGKGKPPRRVKTSTVLKDLIANNPDYIGYLWESEVDSSVRVIFTATP